MASVYRKGGRWWVRFKGADGRWRGAPAKAMTKPAARLEALEREKLARHQREGLVPSDDNRRRTFGELMNLWHELTGRGCGRRRSSCRSSSTCALPSASSC